MGEARPGALVLQKRGEVTVSVCVSIFPGNHRLPFRSWTSLEPGAAACCAGSAPCRYDF